MVLKKIIKKEGEMIEMEHKFKFKCPYNKKCILRGPGCYNVEADIVALPVHCDKFRNFQQAEKEAEEEIYGIIPYSIEDPVKYSRYKAIIGKYSAILDEKVLEEIEDRAVARWLRDRSQKIKELKNKIKK